MLFLEGWVALHVLGSLMSLQRWVRVALGEAGRPSCPWVLNVRGKVGLCCWRDGSSFMSLGPSCPWVLNVLAEVGPYWVTAVSAEVNRYCPWRCES